MASTAPLLLRIVANSVTISHRVGDIVRDIMKKGELAIIDKVSVYISVWACLISESSPVLAVGPACGWHMQLVVHATSCMASLCYQSITSLCYQRLATYWG